MNFTAKRLPRNLLGPLMQGAVCLAKFIYYPDVHDKQRYDLGVLLGDCAIQWNLRDTYLLIRIALYCCQLFESQRYMFINFTFNVLYFFFEE